MPRKQARQRKVPIGPPPVKSRRRAREITTEFHRITHELQRLQQENANANNERIEEQKRSLERRLKDLGGRQAYQDLLTKFGLRPAKKMPPLNVLEVGAINTQLLACKWLNVQAIDLFSRHSKIEQLDFFDLDIEKKFDVVVSSMVVNCVPTPEKRGEMLQKTWHHLYSNGHLFLMLPLLCLTNSNFMTVERFEAILQNIGFHVREKKETPKIAFYCLQKQDQDGQLANFAQEMLCPGPKRNDFSVVVVN